jgi:hypothetical protein
MEPAMDRDILGAAACGKITGAVSAIDPNVFMDLVANQGFENTVHVVIGDQAKAAAVGPEQQVNRRHPGSLFYLSGLGAGVKGNNMEAAVIMDQDIGEFEAEENLSEDDLPAGIFPETHPESCYHALKKYGFACTRLNAELFYEMNQLGRNRMMGCSTEELREIDLWDQCSDCLSGMRPWPKIIAR